MSWKYLLSLLVLALSFNSNAQVLISGRVHNATNEPVAGATITLEATRNSVVTTPTGAFEIQADPRDKHLIVTAVGYTSRNIDITSSTNYDIVLELAITELQDVVFVGSRTAQRSRYNSIVPVDVVRLSDVQLQVPQIGVNELLTTLVPSFNSNRQSASDGTEHIDPASLRGLGPDQVLVLINGKRRHTTSLVNYQNTVGNGTVGTDMNAIPTSAIERIEVLRDGASAQYGSDAIAGVINIVLKKNSGFTLSATGGGATAGDGGLVNINANYGTSIAKDHGFINLTLERNFRDATNRTQNHDLIIFDQSALNNFFAYPFTDDPAASRAYDDEQLAAKGLTRDDFNFHVGDARSTNTQGFVNFGYQLNDKNEIYANAGLNVRQGTGYGFRRLPSETANVVASIFPNGFQPTLNSDIVDNSLTAGIRHKFGGWTLDVSNTFGRNSFDYEVKNTNNSSMGDQSPTDFDAGSHSFTQNTLNADITRTIAYAGRTINLAYGAEYRTEKFEIKAGQEESWKLYTINENGVAGSQSFPGFTPDNAVTGKRNNISLYADADINFVNKYFIDAAARFEHYSDFGSTINGKLAFRYNVNDKFAFRTGLNSGFRAPSLHQQYFSNFYSDIAQDGSGIVNKGIFPVNSEVAKAIGMPELKQETSISYSLGITTRPAKNLVITADAYLIDIDNRIVITSSIVDDRIAALGVESGRFFTNAIDTRTRGIDIVATYSIPVNKNKLDLSFASNFNKTTIEKYHFPESLSGLNQDDYFGPDQQSLIETNYPKSKYTLSANFGSDKWNFLFRNIYWGKVTRNGYPFGVVQEHSPKVTTDIAASIKFFSALSFTLGANNILDVYPDEQVYDNSYFKVFKYAPVQMGMLGAFYYARLTLTLGKQSAK
ncbi:MAG TPA: TonB-dependent receptor [Flavitalea sp.]|nr:TonB-dependent receptor [Flavitalea sp.]